MTKKYVLLDFEFNNTSEQLYNLVCVAGLIITDSGNESFQYWLYQSPHNQSEFIYFINKKIEEEYTLIAWSGTAELRCLISLGLDIDSIKLIDAQVEFKLYANCDTFKNWRDEAEAKARAKAKLQGSSYSSPKGRYSLDVAALILLGETYDEKKDMQRLIVGSTEFTELQRQQILDYCQKDVFVTYRAFKVIAGYMYSKHTEMRSKYLKQALMRGEYVKACTWVEYFGYPIDKNMLSKIADNAQNIQEGFIREHSPDIIDCFLRTVEKKTRKGILIFEENRFCNETFAAKLKKFGLDRTWPTSPKMQAKFDVKGEGKRAYLTDIETFEDHKKDSEFIAELVSLKRKLSGLKYLTKQKKDDILDQTLLDKVSSKERIHCYLNPYGTTTGRNAPPAKHFIFAQSSWERVLVKPKSNKVIIGLDYRAQEILIAGLVAQDENFIEDYVSGDPYTNFAVGCELLEQTDLIAYRNKQLTLADLKKKYAHFRDTVLKPVFLGLSYGLGPEELSKSIGKPSYEGYMYYYAHKKRYRSYWKDAQEFVNHMYKTGAYFAIGDDWGVYESSRFTTLINWRIQGTGGAVLRKLAIALTHKNFRVRGIKLICLLHDAIYLEVDFGNEKDIAEEISEIMVKTFHDILPSETKIGIEYKFYYPENLWIEKKAEKTWENIKKFVI